jgi:hypothetical protein
MTAKNEIATKPKEKTGLDIEKLKQSEKSRH